MSFINRTLLYQALADVTIGNSSAEASGLSSMRTAPPLIPGWMPQPGTELQCTASGFYTLPSLINLADLTVKVMLGGTSLVANVPASLLNTFGLGNTSATFELTAVLTYRSVGVTGKVASTGCLAFQDSLGGKHEKDLLNGGVDLTVDTTVDNTFDVRVKWSQANASSMTFRAAKLMAVAMAP